MSPTYRGLKPTATVLDRYAVCPVSKQFFRTGESEKRGINFVHHYRTTNNANSRPDHCFSDGCPIEEEQRNCARFDGCRFGISGEATCS